ncbi:hypothetical protein CDV36_000866 [Fusarium kuroshium]|uniref:Uncharacterized protein n=1 Tax=Fusarium kuroshium TaxID=2010991 RepID=A0A3M2SPJ2_9HYPO|nr:hypothetical protein CDV36_000866 [Fusarium kuroshium]
MNSRKIKPSHVEKLVYGDGSGDTFMAVTDTDIGRIGQPNCWENMNPFLKSLNRISHEDIKKNTPPGVEPEAHPERYNGWGRIFAPDGTCIDLNETHIPKAVHDYGGHYGRPDLIRLLVDIRRKELVTEADPNGNIATYSTRERLL